MLGSPFAAMGLANLAQQFGSGGDFEELSNCCYSPGLDDIPPLHRQQLEIAAGGLPAAAGLAGIGGYPGLSGSPALTQVGRELHSIFNGNFHFCNKDFVLSTSFTLSPVSGSLAAQQLELGVCCLFPT